MSNPPNPGGNLFPGNDPFAGLTPNLTPNPPPGMPEAQSAGDGMSSASPFLEPQDIDQIIKQLTLDRPLKLFIPNRDKYPGYEFRIINSIPAEIADAHNKGWKEVTNPEMTELFTELVAGTNKDGKAFRPILCSRPKAVGDHIRKRNRLQLASLYAGMDPKNKDLEGKYTNNVRDGADASRGQFAGAPFRIKA